jgi:protein TonB
MNANRLWFAAILSGAVHCVAFVPILIFWLFPLWLPACTGPQLIEAYGDSDREGFPVETVAANPGAWREGDEHTPGGDGVPEALEADQKPDLTPAAPEPRMELPAATVADSKTTDSTTVASNQTPGPQLPGATGGARMPIGTPSAGGTVGSRSGVRMSSGAAPPVYPQAAREAGMEGTVVIWLRISADGQVMDAKVQRSSGHQLLDDTALSWAQKQKFIPAKIGSTPIESEATKPVKFYLY